jgi:malto-oligosyltrehalose trehalohydrolase
MGETRFGATYDIDGTVFRVWAPGHTTIKLRLRHRDPIVMDRAADGWHETRVSCKPGDQYQYIVGDSPIADPAASAQADQLAHGWSVVTDPHAYVWKNHAWSGRPWHEVIFYEVHPGLGGGFRGLMDKLADIEALGFTALELMPIAQFPGSWNWGYDGVLPFAPDRTYGTPDDLKALIDKAHGLGMMIFLDVVYNHFGPDGNNLPQLAPEFFRDDIHTPWGSAIDFRRQQVRQFFTENAKTWISEFRFDGLRFDAVHAIRDEGWLTEMAAEVRAVAPDRHIHLVLENDKNQADFLRSGFDAQWNDDYHHVMHVLLTGEREAYYQDYADEPIKLLARSLRDGFIYQGQASTFRDGEPRGSISLDLPPTSFVNFLQNHDQIGNRAFGDRLTTLTQHQSLKAAIALLLLSPQIPLVFMGEEIGSNAPFHYFVDHTPELIEAIRAGRQKEFQTLVSDIDDLPEPNARETFDNSRPDTDAPDEEQWRGFYRRLLDLRAALIIPRLSNVETLGAEVIGVRALKASWRLADGRTLTIATNLGEEPVSAAVPSARPIWGSLARGQLPPLSTTAWLLP